jgi:hypothetical protein
MSPTLPRARAGWSAAALVTAVAALAAAAVIHLGVVDVHAQQWAAEGAFFLLLAMAEAFLAVALVTSGSRVVTKATIVLSLGTVALWATSRTVGVPLGPAAWDPEPVGLADSIATSLELATVAALVPVVLPAPRPSATAVVSATIGIAACLAAVAAVRAAGHDHTAGLHGGAHSDRGRPGGPGDVVGAGYFAASTGFGPLDLRVGVGPARPGANTIDVVVQDDAGRRARVRDVRLVARRGDRIRRFRGARLAPGHFVVDVARFRTPGWWKLRVAARAREAGAVSTTIMVPIRR